MVSSEEDIVDIEEMSLQSPSEEAQLAFKDPPLQTADMNVHVTHINDQVRRLESKGAVLRIFLVFQPIAEYNRHTERFQIG